jgi:hypothetical protein
MQLGEGVRSTSSSNTNVQSRTISETNKQSTGPATSKGEAAGGVLQVVNENLETVTQIRNGLDNVTSEKQAITNIIIDRIGKALVTTKNINQVNAASIINSVQNFNEFPKVYKEPTITAPLTDREKSFLAEKTIPKYNPDNWYKDNPYDDKKIRVAPKLKTNEENKKFIQDVAESFFKGDKLDDLYKEKKSLWRESPITEKQFEKLKDLQNQYTDRLWKEAPPFNP